MPQGDPKRRSKANLAPQGCSKRRSKANLAPQDCSKRRSRANFHALWPPKMPFQDHHNVYFSEADPKLLQMQPNCNAHMIFDSIKLIQNFCKCYQTAALTKRHCRWISTGALELFTLAIGNRYWTLAYTAVCQKFLP